MNDLTTPINNDGGPESEPDRLRLELEQARTELEALRRRKSSLVAMTAHDLRTPLAIVQGFAQLLASELGPDTDPAVDEYISNILAHSSSMEKMVENLVALDQYERGEINLKAERGNLNVLLDEALAQVEGLSAIKTLTISFRPAPAAAWVFVDVNQIGKALYNLLSHTIKYARPGSLIEIDITRAGEFLKVRFFDTNRRLTTDMIARLFNLGDMNPDGQNATGGMDMGLVLTRYIAEQHHGRIEATSRKGHGTTLDLFLPADHEE